MPLLLHWKEEEHEHFDALLEKDNPVWCRWTRTTDGMGGPGSVVAAGDENSDCHHRWDNATWRTPVGSNGTRNKPKREIKSY